MVPKPDRYELDDIDYEFLNEFNKNRASNEQLAKDQLETMIATFEIRSGKETTIIENEAIEIMPSDIKEKLKDKFRESELYGHWRKRREMMKRPLLRLFWKANPED
jgi:hypothetical protein